MVIYELIFVHQITTYIKCSLGVSSLTNMGTITVKVVTVLNV